jgi:phosphatidyl-myo-inositol dimannoside synthase
VLLNNYKGGQYRLKFIALALWKSLLDKPQLIVCTHLYLAPLGWLIARISGAQIWVSLHGIEVWAPLKGLRRFAIEHADLLLPVSRFTASKVANQLGHKKPITAVLPNAYDNLKFTPGPRSALLLERYGLDADQPLILSLTRLSKDDRRKNIDKLIKSIPKLLCTHPNLVLLIGGDGDDRPRLLNLVQQLGLKRSVLLPGRILEDELPDHYRLASAFVLPSDKEGFGIVFLEALGCGCPVMAGNRDGSRDPLDDGRFGLLVDLNQPLEKPL